MRLQFGTQSYQHASIPLSAQEMVNCYLEPAPPGAKTLAAVPGCYGIDEFATVGPGPIRGGLFIKGKLYVVSGTGLYSVSSLGTETLLGTVPGTRRVGMAGDETHVMIVDGGAGYYYNGATVQAISDTDFPGAVSVANIDGYYLVIAPNSGRFYLSQNRNPASWDALEFATAEKYPDDLVQVVINFGEAILFGTESGEVWVDTGNADFALERQPAGFFEKGCLSRLGAAKADNRVFFPGHDGIVYALNGYQPERVSTYAIEQAIADAEDKDFVGLSWAEGGHTFYGLTCNDFTLAYDISTGLWHRRQSYQQSNWRAAQVIRAFGKWLVLDSLTNKVGEMTPDIYTEFGDVLRTSCTSPPVQNDNKRVFHGRVELVFDQGNGTLTGQGSDPKVMLRSSDDGGRTWSSERWRSLGAMGKYRSRAVWERNGSARDRIYQYAVSDPVRRTLVYATAEVEGGAY